MCNYFSSAIHINNHQSKLKFLHATHPVLLEANALLKTNGDFTTYFSGAKIISVVDLSQ